MLEKLDPEHTDQIQKRTLDYVSKFAHIEAAQGKRMRSALKKECSLTDEEAAELVNTCPRTVEELRVFTAGWKKLLPADMTEKILRILKESA